MLATGEFRDSVVARMSEAKSRASLAAVRTKPSCGRSSIHSCRRRWVWLLPTEPVPGKAVEFDDCEQKSGTMVDYKHKYWMLLSEPGIKQFIIDDLKKRALQQIDAAGSRGIRLVFR
jgi:hypothetical protein